MRLLSTQAQSAHSPLSPEFIASAPWRAITRTILQTFSNIKFSDLPLHDQVRAGISEAGFESCTPIQAESLPPALLEPQPRRQGSGRLPQGGANLDEMVNSFEAGLLREALERTGGVKKKAAQLLAISFRSFRYRLEKLGIEDTGRDDG